MTALTWADVDFLATTVKPEVHDRIRLKELLETDEDFRQAFVGHEQVVQRVLSDKEAFVRLSPRVYFEILLRQTRQDLQGARFTVEKIGSQKVAVFDTQEVAKLLARPPLLYYLAEMLASFTRIESYTITYRVGEGVWQKLRFSDLDLESLINLCDWVEEDYRLGFFKRIADICLFMAGIFPDYITATERYPFSGDARPPLRGVLRWSASDYHQEGQKFYRLAAAHRQAEVLKLTDIFHTLSQDFHKAVKPLAFMAQHYLPGQRQRLFQTA